jgi:ESS family glutamate:Na+ symporter
LGTSLVHFSHGSRALEALGSVALAFFLAIALADLKLWLLASLAGPMLLLMASQTVLTRRRGA